ncbi:MAG: NADPH-dependent FMN reductase [Chloroflexota bacterium]
MTTLIISCSLHPQSRSYVLAKQAALAFEALGEAVVLIDLRDHDLKFYDTVFHLTEEAQALRRTIEAADTVLMALPIYNYDVNAAAKNLTELTGRAWMNKLVGFLCAAGGKGSYMSVMSFANSLMLDFRCIIVPRFVYAMGSDFGDDREPTMHIASETIQERVKELVSTTAELKKRLFT